MEFILVGDLGFKRIKIGYKGPSGAGGGIMGSGYTHAADIGIPKVQSSFMFALPNDAVSVTVFQVDSNKKLDKLE